MGGARTRDLEEIYRLCYPRFLRLTTAITGDPDAGHDAVQEGFAAALRHRSSYRGDGPLEAWIWRAVVNEARQVRRRREELTGAEASADRHNGSRDDLGVRAWIAILPERQRLAVFLRYFADLDYRSIADILDVEVGTVSATLSTAHATLRKHLMGVGR